ncbi:hypothetical protein BDB00DRAFT_926596 [Zychaea mexicana]|uniref:uncharacterized protein n=1 Tax=Zychaea mexicana TaxID=64656 RepID=UPI0022FDD145|nr:uncharacterized protein BDB00DRAFT_926596 [Zychaea mexicana]KAI9496720.1 hypothetical protein BDB00DRAFT_926596 [Zychaea mexicana]
MVVSKQAYSSLFSAFQWSSSKPGTSSKQVVTTLSPLDKAQEKAQKIIRASPTSAKGYIQSARVYKESGDLQKALGVYRQGLRFVPPEDPLHAQLQKEKQQVSATLLQRSRGFHQLLPYDVVCLIFGSLDFRDMLRCTGVCQGWCNFMMDWPEFWQRMSREMPQMSRSTLDPLLRRQAQEFRLDGQDAGLVHDILVFLAHSDNHFMQKLSFKNITLTFEQANLLGTALKSTSPPVKRIEFVDCKIPITRIVAPILQACSSMEHISFSQTDAYGTLPYGDAPKKKDFRMPDFEYTSLTYLKLGVDNAGNNYGLIDNGRLAGILSRCLNLVHLFLDSNGTTHHGYNITQVLKHCHRLESLVVGPKADLPAALSHIDESEFDSISNNDSVAGPPSSTSLSATPSASNNGSSNKSNNSSSPPRGLRRLILSGSVNVTDSDMVSIYKKCHSTLELLYLHYDGARIASSSFYRLAYHEAPKLREIYLATENASGTGNAKHPPIAKALTALFSSCPAVEVIDINDSLSASARSFYGGCYLRVSNGVLKSIAENCFQLRKLRIVGCRQHTKDGLIHFASTGKLRRLVDLEMDMEWQNVLEVVNNLTSLQRLHVRKDSYGTQTAFPQSHKETASRILGERGGDLTLA